MDLYSRLEILLLNDGSQDVSLEVCKMYANVDPRIVLIDKAIGAKSALAERAFPNLEFWTPAPV